MEILISAVEGAREFKDEKKKGFRPNKPVFLDWVTQIEKYDYLREDHETYEPLYIIRFIGDHFFIDWTYNSQLVRDDRYKEILEHFKKNLNAKII